MTEQQNMAPYSALPLTKDAFEACKAMIIWIDTVRKHGGDRRGLNWLPSEVDMSKSRLFWRIRSGKAPLPEAPPTAYSCPWYEVIDEPERPHWAYDGSIGMLGAKKMAFIAQCPYEILDLAEDERSAILKFNCWTFRAFIGEQDTVTWDPTTKTSHPSKCEGWFIQRLT